MTHRLAGSLACLLGLSGVVLAAMGSHAISFDDDRSVRLWDIAVQLHLAHAVVILVCALASTILSRPSLNHCALTFALGVIAFSGSLYLRAAGIDGLPGFITPMGGLVLMVAWAWAGLTLLRTKQS